MKAEKFVLSAVNNSTYPRGTKFNNCFIIYLQVDKHVFVVARQSLTAVPTYPAPCLCSVE